MPPSAPKTKSASSTLSPNWPHYASIATICVAVLGALMRYFVIDNDRYHCGALLGTGLWTSESKWQPDGCMTTAYNPASVATCMASRSVVFIGDSITRQLFYAMAKIADPSAPDGPATDGEKHKDASFTAQKGGVDFKFFWDPFLNSTKTAQMLSTPHRVAVGHSQPSQPALLVLGSGLWYLRHPDSGSLGAWGSRIDETFRLIAEASTGTSLSKTVVADEVIFLPVLEPVQELLSPDRAKTLRTSDIDAMNSDLAAKLSPEQSLLFAPKKTTGPTLRSPPPPVSLPTVFNQLLLPEHTSDGLHFSSKILDTQAQILYNFRCNDVMPKKFPMDKTCCKKYPSVGWLQGMLLFIIVCWVPIGRIFQKPLSAYPALSALFPTEDGLCLTLMSFGLCAGLTFFADRTGFWLKENKIYDATTFTVCCLAALAVGLATSKRSEGGKDLGFLNREQTDEWKGWMQIIILIYHYTGASKISGIYNPVRVCVAAYLFMTGYGHFTFYLKKSDFGIARVAMVMVRLNLLPIVLAYTMDTDYISYYFSPLVSFWYLIIYATMFAGHKYNDNAVFLSGKLLISAGLVTWFMKTEWLLASFFNFLAAVANIHWSAREWTFRVTLDLWVVYLGMFTAYAYIKIKEFGLPSLPWWPTVVKGSVAASVLALAWFFWFEINQPTKFAYNAVHPVVSFVPILAFIVLRNATPALRSISSSLFCFIGQISLETFILQFHIWLAGDTKGVLLIVPGTKWRLLNVVVTTVVFIFLSQKTSQATGKLTDVLVGKPKKPKGLPLPATTTSTTNGAANGSTNGSAPSSETDPSKSAENGGADIPLLTPGESSSSTGEAPSTNANGGLAEGWRASPVVTGFKGSSILSGWTESISARLAAMLVFVWVLNLLSPWP